MKSSEDLKAFIGRRVYELRRARGLTQEQLAELAGKTQTDIDRWENGRGLVQLPGLLAVVQALGVSLAEFWRPASTNETEERLIAARWMKRLAEELEKEALSEPEDAAEELKAQVSSGSPEPTDSADNDASGTRDREEGQEAG